MSDLKPCPFCGNTKPEIERYGTHRQSCIVACGNCGARHESSDEGKNSGASWSHREQPAQAGALLPREVTAKLIREAGGIPCGDGAFMGGTTNLYKLADLVEQAVRAKLGAGVPMTDPQISRLFAESWSTSSAAAFHQAVRAAEKFHGIVGKEGA